MGDKLDKANAGSLTKGYHVTMMAGMNHWVFTTDPVEIQVDGTGPFAIIYANPADDPRGASRGRCKAGTVTGVNPVTATEPLPSGSGGPLARPLRRLRWIPPSRE